MSDLGRWSEEGATAEEQSLLDASRREHPSAIARTRTLQALGVGTALTTAGAAGAASGLGVLAKIIGLGVLVGGVFVGAMAWRGSRHDSPTVPASASVSVESQAIPPDTADAPNPIPSDAPSSEIPSTPIPPSSPKVARSAHPESSSAPSLSQEVVALERAHKLATRDPDTALKELDRYHSQFPTGALSAEETVLRVQALLARGDDKKAVALADSFCAEHPESPYARRVQDLVRDKRK